MCARVRDVMTPGPIGVDYDQSIGEAARTMRDWGIGAVLVVRDGVLYGLVTDRDLVVRAVAEAKGPDEPVGPLSSPDLIGVDAGADVAVAARLMRDHAVRRLPVLQDGQVTGIVSLGTWPSPNLRRPGWPRSPGRPPPPEAASVMARTPGGRVRRRGPRPGRREQAPGPAGALRPPVCGRSQRVATADRASAGGGRPCQKETN